jgi:hypothetical protein
LSFQPPVSHHRPTIAGARAVQELILVPEELDVALARSFLPTSSISAA